MTSALAQVREQFLPLLVYRTGAYTPNDIPFANGYVDHRKLTNARGGINGVKVNWEECETAYATDRGVECYQRLKAKNGGATVFQPLPTGITFALTEKAPGDKVPLITAGYGRSDIPARSDVRPLVVRRRVRRGAGGRRCQSYNALALQHSCDFNAAMVKEIQDKVHAKGQGTGPREEVDQVSYLRGPTAPCSPSKARGWCRSASAKAR
ncbi:MAG: periplasmic binding family protein [Ramlibacter sp.]|nr:periplasmic binding family protein [Ramlibacter sp.]